MPDGCEIVPRPTCQIYPKDRTVMRGLRGGGGIASSRRGATTLFLMKLRVQRVKQDAAPNFSKSKPGNLRKPYKPDVRILCWRQLPIYYRIILDDMKHVFCPVFQGS